MRKSARCVCLVIAAVAAGSFALPWLADELVTPDGQAIHDAPDGAPLVDDRLGYLATRPTTRLMTRPAAATGPATRP